MDLGSRRYSHRGEKMMTSQPYTKENSVAIIGFGAAGFNAAVALRTHGYTGTIRVFSSTDMLPYSPILTSYYAGGEKAREECFPWSQAEVDELNLEIMKNSPVISLDVTDHMVYTEHGAYPYDKCVIASGSIPTAVGFPKDCGYSPIMLRTMEDAERLKQAISNPGCRRMLVSGASMVSLKTLEACLNYGIEMTLVGIMPHVLDMNALPEAAIRFERGLTALGVELKLANSIKTVEVIEDSAHPLGRRLKVGFANGDCDEFDEIAVAHGMRNNLEFVQEGTLEMDRGLLVDGFMRTSDKDVYAAGDVVQARELITGERRIVGIWKNAVKQGACAGKVIAAELAGKEVPAEYELIGSFAMNTIGVRGILFISAGTIDLSGNRYTELHETDDMTLIRIYEDGADGVKRLVGFNLTCDKDEEGGDAYDLGAMLTMQIEQDCTC